MTGGPHIDEPNGTRPTEPTSPRCSVLLQQYGDASSIAASVVDQVLARDAHGQRKYGVSLDRSDLTVSQWLQHLAEELMDGAHYALAAKREHDQFEVEVLGIVRSAHAKLIAEGAWENTWRSGVDALLGAIERELSK